MKNSLIKISVLCSILCFSTFNFGVASPTDESNNQVCSISGVQAPCYGDPFTYTLNCSGAYNINWIVSGGGYSISTTGNSADITFDDASSSYSVTTTYQVGRNFYLEDITVNTTSTSCSIPSCYVSGDQTPPVNQSTSYSFTCPNSALAWTVSGGDYLLSTSGNTASITFEDSCEWYTIEASYNDGGSLESVSYVVYVSQGLTCP